VATELVLVRHGETVWNTESRIQGHSDSPLTPLGLAQARAIAERLGAERFDALISSDLGRARDTAGAIAGRTGHRAVEDARLRERNFGVGEGLTYGELDHQYPDVFSRVRETDPDFRIPEGESRRQFHERVVAAFTSVAERHEGKRVVVVTHGGVLAILYRHVHGLGIVTPHAIPIVNASYNVLRFEAGTWQQVRWGDTAHLAATDGFEEP
jgi:2,3-bisphosphoglycerate-dependent phosphoglycerate mutase